MMRRIIRTLVLGVSCALSACATMPESYDYTAYNSHPPRSILVLPPTNDSVAVDAPYVYLSTITRPLAEAGYYVFPVAVIDRFMTENGLADPAEMHAVALTKLDEIIGPDAVLYVHIVDWGQKYQVISSNTTVDIKARLVDVASGTQLWEGEARAVEASGNGQNGLIGMAIAALVDQIVDTVATRSREVAVGANAMMINDPNDGLPLGPYNPDHVTDPRRQ